jgi:hypothetical protein
VSSSVKNCHFLSQKKGQGKLWSLFPPLNSSVIRHFFCYFIEKFAKFFIPSWPSPSSTKLVPSSSTARRLFMGILETFSLMMSFFLKD